ncbi:unnamed protein product [Gongylonema pulchrum]|uniref:Rod_C domain-containing protein n=1 Tax=Gongylonema pulchrum TaxID=637853 RepID=A0A183CX69_9BILA|nr:unnamed protein product [Gongylonema pulchrum]
MEELRKPCEREIVSSEADPALKVSGGECVIASEEESGGSLYKKMNLLIGQLPARALSRLPFHPFLFESPKDLQNTLLPIIHAELTLCNVENWQTFIRAMPKIHISKSDLLSSTVLMTAQACINKAFDIDQSDIDRIKQLLLKTTNRLRTLKGLTDGFKHLPLCEMKLRILSLGIDVINEWLVASQQQEQDSGENDFLVDFLRNLTEAYRNYSTEYVLKKFGLLKQETLDLVSETEDLIEHIYANEVDWNSPKDVDEKTPCAAELARVLGLSLDTIQDRVIRRWLDWDTHMAVVFDPNETGGSDAAELAMVMQKPESSEEIYKLPYMDLTVSSTEMTSHETKIRSICCLLRLLQAEEFPNIMKRDIADVCSALEFLLYARMIDAYKIELRMETFHKTNKTVLLRSLQNNSRQTPQVSQTV